MKNYDTGMNRATGAALDSQGLAHLRQSITDILTTPKGSRVMLREYGSRLFQLIDAPINPNTLIRVYAAIAEALERWEPRLALSRVQLADATFSGQLNVVLEGVFVPTGKPITLDGIVV